MSRAETKSKAKKQVVTDKNDYMAMLLEVIPMESALKILEFENDRMGLRDFIPDFLCTLKLPIFKPDMKYPHLLQHIKLFPKTDLWDKCLVDYIVDAVQWTLIGWVRKTERSVFVEQKWQNNIRYSAACVSLAVFTAYLLLHHLQVWKRNVEVDDSIPRCGISATIEFLKSLFDKSSPKTVLDRKSNYLTTEYQSWKSKYVGFLNTLQPFAAAELLDYITENVLQVCRLLIVVFNTEGKLLHKPFDVDCDLQLESLPNTYYNELVHWPPPLAEALPLALVAAYPDQFDMKVTQHLTKLPPCSEKSELPVNLTESCESNGVCTHDEVKESENEEETTGPTDNTLYCMSKYAYILEELSSDELLALSNLPPEGYTGVVEDVISNCEEMTESNEQKLKIKRFLDELSEYIIQYAQGKTDDLRLTMQ